MTIELNYQQIALIKIALDELENGRFEMGNTNKKIIEQILEKLNDIK